MSGGPEAEVVMATVEAEEPDDIPEIQDPPPADGLEGSMTPSSSSDAGGSRPMSPPNSLDVGSPAGNLAARRRQSRQQSLDYTLAERDALSQVAKDAEMKMTAKRAARAEARDIRLREIEKMQKESEEQEGDAELTDAERRASESWTRVREKLDQIKHMRDKEEKLLRQNTTTSISSSRRSSSGSMTGQDAPVGEMEEKYKKAMMANAQLDNEKSTLIYEVESLKDMLEDRDEQMIEYQREAKEKHRDLQAKKRENANLQSEIEHLRLLVMQRDELIAEHGLLLIGNGEESTETDQGTEERKKNSQLGTILVIPPEAAQLLEFSGDGSLDVRLKRLLEERKELLEQVRILRIELAEEKDRVLAAERRRDSPPSPSMNGPDPEALDQHRETARQAKEYKHKLQTTEQKVSTLETSVSRLEGQVKRYKTAAETSESTEEELKAEKRKTTRELRALRDRVDELESENNSLKKRIEKFRKREIQS